MYNDLMPDAYYEIRVCESCGLRYPLVEGHPFGTRCPTCLGDTHVILSRALVREPHLDSLGVDPQQKNEKPGGGRIAVLLDNIRSAWNVGSILRSADGFGFSHAFLCGITPSADHEAVTKTSLGAEDSVPWSYHKDAVRLVQGLNAEGWKVQALEDAPRGVDIRHATSVTYGSEPMVLIVGNEVTGVDPGLLDLCDEILYIPMRGEKKSFNVAIAFGIAAYAISVSVTES